MTESSVDFTERKRMVERLGQSEGLYRIVVENVHDGLTIIENGKIAYVNDRACEIFGYPKADILKMTGIDVAAPEEKERVQLIQADSIRTGKLPEQIEFWIVQKDGTRKCIQNRYSPLASMGRFAS